VATQKLIPVPERTDHAGTAPLPPVAAEMLARLQSVPLPPSVFDVLTRHAAAARTTRDLSACTAWMAPAEFDRLADVQDAMAMYRHQIKQAGRSDLLGEAS